jgi:chaperonin GroES
MNELHPVNQHVLVDIESSDQEQRTSGGIIIPDTVKERPEIGKVIALSRLADPEIAVGEKVLFKKYSGTETEFEGHSYLLIPYADILAKIVETDEI